MKKIKTILHCLFFLVLTSGCGSGMCHLREGCWLSPWGMLDVSFGTGGIKTVPMGTTALIYSVKILSDNKFLVSGVIDATSDVFVARLTSQGDLDPSFGSGGYTSTDFGLQDISRAMGFQSDGKIILGGMSNNSGTYDFILSRYSPNGIFDTTFGTAGRTYTNIALTDNAYAIAIQPDNKIILGGNSSTGGFADFTIARYSPEGILDTTYGTAGITITNVAGGILNDSIRTLLLLPDGKLIAGGNVSNTFTLVRYNEMGILDTTFGTAGVVQTAFSGIAVTLNTLALHDGKILAAGYAFDGVGSLESALVRYNLNGNLDTTFGNGGKSLNHFSSFDEILSLSIQPDGKILASGKTTGATDNLLLMRYLSNGSIDTTFAQGGRIIVDPNGTNESLLSINQFSNGKIIGIYQYFNGSVFIPGFVKFR